ncbi:flippase [Paenibacillus sp. RC67]|uniref:flippase n=1 Tax=Paenibacillus sp. RC67 TaxID=3039392 RepID=UPI0024ACB9C5|nr:flippase [Paenibacillus sp. RC67]
MNIRKRHLEKYRSLLSNDIANKIMQNSTWLISDKVVNLITGVIVTAAIARYFGPDLFGQFNYALALVTLFTAFSALGLETLTVKNLVNKEYDEGTILCTSLVLRVIGGIVLTIIAAIAIKIIEPANVNLHIIVYILSFTMVVRSMEVIEYWIQAHQRSKVSSIIRISVYIITAILKLMVVVFGGSLVHFSLVYVVDVAITGLALIIVYFKIRQDRTHWILNFSYAREIMSKSWSLILSGLMVTLYMRVDQVMLGSMLPDKAELGVFSAAVRIAEMWYFVPMAVIVSFKPIIIKNKNVDQQSYLKSVQLLYTIVAWMSIGFGLIILLLSKPIIKVLFGADYLSAASILVISVWAGTFAMLGSARSIWLICEGLQKFTITYTLGGLVVNILLNILLIPQYGAYGAAIATLASQLTANVVVLAFFKKTRKSSIMILKSLFPGIVRIKKD